MSPTSTTAFPSGSYPTSLTPRQHSPSSIFERHQQEILLINVPLPNSRKESEHGNENLAPGATSLSPRASSVCDADLIDEMEELGSPSSFHTAMDLISPTFGNIGLGVPLSPVPVTPKTSTSITSFMSEMSTLGPLATQQDIKDNKEREDRHLVAQRRKLEHMLGDSVVVGIDTESGGMKARCLAEPKGAESDMDDWEILADNGNTSKSKLERTLGQGADSAHVALNAEYRKRPGDSLDIERNSREETTESVIVPLSKAIPASFKSMIEGQSTSSTTPARPSFPPASSESSGKLVGSGSFTAVLQAGRKRFQSKQQGSLTPCRGRSSSPETVDASQCEREEREKMTDDDLKVVNDLDPVERKILLKRTRKLERVLGETLKEREVGQHVVQCHAEKCASTDANEREDAHRPRVSLDRIIQPRCSEESQTEAGLPRLSLKRASPVDMSPLDQVDKDGDSRNAIPVNDGNLHAGSKEEFAPREASLPRAPKTRARRYSSPISPGNDAWHDDDDVLWDLATPDYFARERSSVELDRRRRRLQMIKLNRLLGARVPPELLGTARNPPFSPFVVQEPDAKAADVVTEAEDSAKKTRAVKVTSKMYYVFGELPPPNRYLADASSTPHTSHRKRSSRSALRAHVDSYYQSIQSIRYLLENDRQSLEHVIGDIQEDAVPVDALLEETDKDVASAAEQEAGEAYGLQRQRSLSTPCLPTGLPSHKRSFKTANASPQATDNLNIESLTSLRKRAAKLNSFFGDPRIGSGHIGRESKQYIITDKKVALEKLLLELEDNANFDAEQGDLKEQELSEIRSQLLSVRRSASLLIVAPDASIADAA